MRIVVWVILLMALVLSACSSINLRRGPAGGKGVDGERGEIAFAVDTLGLPYPAMLKDVSPEATRARAEAFLAKGKQCNLATCENCCLVTAIYALTGKEMSFREALGVRRFPESRSIDSTQVYLFILDYHYLNSRGLPYFHAGVYYPASHRVCSRIDNRWKTVPIETYRAMSREKGYTIHFYKW